VHYVGPELADPAWSTAWQSPFAADDKRPLVLVGLSSIYQNQIAVLGRIVRALSRLPVRALVTLGPVLLPSEVNGSDNVVVVQSAPHSKVLEHTSLLITHCGHGTTMKGLAAGVPLLCMPLSLDQPDTAARVVYRGAGLRLKPEASPEQIEAAVKRLLADPSFKEGALRLQRVIQTRQGCADPITLLLKLAAGKA
jgi:MGT family glycosyltransferase